MTLEMLLEFFDICCLGRCKTPKVELRPLTAQVYLIDGVQVPPPNLAEEVDRTPSPPDPKETEWFSDFTLTEVESEVDSEIEEDEPEIYIVILDKWGNERRVNLKENQPPITPINGAALL